MKQYHVFSIYQLCLKEILIFVDKSLNCLLPCHCTNYFTETKSIHSHATRGGHDTNLYLVKALEISNYIKTTPSINIFKNCLNQHSLTSLT